jgi:hypothetical protein
MIGAGIAANVAAVRRQDRGSKVERSTAEIARLLRDDPDH